MPYGVEPFSGTRLDAMRQLFDRLTAQGFQGNVDIRTYGGRFCLVGNASDGYSLAPDDLLYSRCDLVSGGRDDPSAGPVRIPVAMADLMGSAARQQPRPDPRADQRRRWQQRCRLSGRSPTR